MRGLADTRRKRILWDFLERLFPYLQVRPASGRFWLDLVYLCLLLAIQQTILAQILGSVMLVNLVGVWLVANCILLPVTQCFALCLAGGFLLETYGTVPMGLYMTTYWVIAAVLFLVRDNLSWCHLSPWLASAVLAELWVILFEALTIGVEFQYGFDQLSYFILNVVRLLLTAGMAIVVFRLYRRRIPLKGVL